MQSGPYTLTEINNILSAATALLDVNELQLLKLPHDAQVAAAFDEQLSQKLKCRIDDTAQLHKIVMDTLNALDDIWSFNRNHLLAYLFTSYFQKGQVINLDSLSAVNCWHILHVSLKELKNFSKLDAQTIEGLWLGFIGQLVKTENAYTACAIHNYLHLARRIAMSSACGMGVANTAKVIGAPLLEGLQLKGRLDQNALVQEYIFMAKVCEVLLHLPQFSQPFNVDAYLPWSLPKGAFYSIQATLLGALCDPTTPSPYNHYSGDVLKAQALLAARTSVKKVSFADESALDAQDDLESVMGNLSSFSLVSSDTLLANYQSKRSKPESSTQDVVEVASLDENPNDSKKSRKGSLSIGGSHKK